MQGPAERTHWTHKGTQHLTKQSIIPCHTAPTGRHGIVELSGGLAGLPIACRSKGSQPPSVLPDLVPHVPYFQ